MAIYTGYQEKNNNFQRFKQ